MAKAIGIVLKEARERAGLSQAAVSRGAGRLSQIESGKSVSPEFSTVAVIAGVLGLSLDMAAMECGHLGSGGSVKASPTPCSLVLIAEHIATALSAERELATALNAASEEAELLTARPARRKRPYTKRKR
jgi:transcriptional regulator with XRE-family HTH domain